MRSTGVSAGFGVSVCAQGKNSCEVFLWLKTVEGLNVKPTDVSNPGSGLILLDRIMACALLGILSGELKRMAACLRATVAEKNEMFGGCDVLMGK